MPEFINVEMSRRDIQDISGRMIFDHSIVSKINYPIVYEIYDKKS
jgi:hypothetical protein